MPQSILRLIERFAEYRAKEQIRNLPRGLRGIYVLYKHRPKLKKFDVVYIGMAKAGRRGGIQRRLRIHMRKKGEYWTHFSAFKVWDNVRDEEIAELEGLFRHIYRRDSGANELNVQRGFKKLRKVRQNDTRKWRVGYVVAQRRG
jgi:hypothetical protein